MKRKIHKSIAFLLTFCMMLPFAFSTTAYAITNQEAYYLSVLRPSDIKNIDQSYPAKLIVNSAQHAWDSDKQSMEFIGYCGVSANIPDEDMLDILKNALSSVGSYRELQDPVDDKVLIQQTLEKLKVSQEDIDKMLENWQKLLGIDNVVSLLSVKIPDVGASDAINAVIDGAQGNIPGLPGMPGVGNVIDGVFISYEQWEKDKAKWKSIAEMYEAKQRIRTYYAVVQEKINEYYSEHGNWTLKINSQDWADLWFERTNGNKQIWTADIELTKTDGSYGNITGTYTGKFAFTMDADLSGYDNTFDDYLLERLNAKESNTYTLAESVLKVEGTGHQRFTWSITDWSGTSSEMLCKFEIPDCVLNLSLPEGTSRAFFEIPIDSLQVFMTEYNRNISRSISVKGVNSDATVSRTMHISIYDDVETYTGTSTVVSSPLGTRSYNLEDSVDQNSKSSVTDYAPNMTLIIDMLGD